jgi:hypothetical protein
VDGYRDDPTLFNKVSTGASLSKTTLLDQAKATLLKLAELRLLASTGSWEEVWKSLNNDWLQVLFSATEQGGGPLYIPIVIRSVLTEEIVCYSVSCVKRIVYPQLIPYIVNPGITNPTAVNPGITSSNPPADPVFIAPLSVTTRIQSPEPLKLLLETLSKYEPFFENNDELKLALHLGRERYQLRHTLYINNLSALEASVKGIQHLPPTDPEYVNACEHIKFLKVSTSLRDYVVNDTPVGDPGSRLFPTTNLPHFHTSIIDINNFILNKTDTYVNYFIKYCDDLYHVRTMLAALGNSQYVTKYDVILHQIESYRQENIYQTASFDVYEEVRVSVLREYAVVQEVPTYSLI